jgi:hypothetical protein
MNDMISAAAPAGAIVGILRFEHCDVHDWGKVYRDLVQQIRRMLLAHFVAFERISRWRDGRHRVLGRNVYADVGLTVDRGCAVIWIAPRNDMEFRRRASWGNHGADAQVWIASIELRFLAAIESLGGVASLSHADHALVA